MEAQLGWYIHSCPLSPDPSAPHSGASVVQPWQRKPGTALPQDQQVTSSLIISSHYNLQLSGIAGANKCKVWDDMTQEQNAAGEGRGHDSYLLYFWRTADATAIAG